MTGRGLRHLWRDNSAAAAAEMALVTPLLMIIMFGSLELGKFFLDEHVVAKAVRDGARYAARQPMGNYSACSGAPGGTVVQDTQRLVRTGQIASGGPARLSYWTNDGTVSLTTSCATAAGGQEMDGIYEGLTTGGATVTVSASVPYTPLVGSIGFNVSGISLYARSQAAVAGI